MHTTTINRAGWLIAGVLALFVVAALTGVVSGGPLDPPGAPSATGTLPQVEPRSPIPPVGWNGTFPIVISEPGSYFLTRSLTGDGLHDGIHIAADNVALDLGGFTLLGDQQTHDGIQISGVRSGIRISNGLIRNWFLGISGYAPTGDAQRTHVDHVTALDNLGAGIALGFGSEITNCNASGNHNGISLQYGVVRGCHVRGNTNVGIYAGDLSLVEDNKVWDNGIGIWVSWSTTGPAANTVRSNTSTNNVSYDFKFEGIENVSDSNVATCPNMISGTGVQTYNQMYQRDVC